MDVAKQNPVICMAELSGCCEAKSSDLYGRALLDVAKQDPNCFMITTKQNPM